MRSLPLDFGSLHFVGIGGIGMSGIAEVLHNLGYSVQGSDLSDGTNVQRLRNLGINIAIGHDAENLGDVQVVVVSSAVNSNNPEILAARERLIPVVRRAEMLGELMRLKWSIAVGGTHGKTTTTSLIAALLDSAGFDPTVINGGIINAWGSNARLGTGDWMVAEADESDGTFLRLPATVAVVTNIDPEHMEHYGSFDGLRHAFNAFVQNIPFYGFATLCVDHPEVQAMIPRVSDRRITTYGFSPQADVRGINLKTKSGWALFDVLLTDRKAGDETTLSDVRLPMIGDHNVQNALAAIAIAREMNISEDVMRGALAKFKGVKRRFTLTGEVDGITVLYGEALVVEEHLAATREHVVDLLQRLMLVVVRSLAPLQRVAGEALQSGQAVAIIGVVFALFVAVATPVDSAEMGDLGLGIPPVENVDHSYLLKDGDLAHSLAKVDEFVTVTPDFVDQGRIVANCPQLGHHRWPVGIALTQLDLCVFQS